MQVGLGDVGRSLGDLTSPPTQRTTGKELGQEDFLKIMIEQMRSQNPLEPQDNNEFFSQIVQFQSLEAMQGMAKAIQALTEVSGLANASSLIGRNVTAMVERSPDPETGMPRPPDQVSGVVERVTFGEKGAVLHLDNGRQVPADRVDAVSG